MHLCLSVSDILLLILENLTGRIHYADWEDCQLGLRSLAAASRYFSEPALDALWNTLPNLVPLMQLLPSDLWEIREQPETDVYEAERDSDDELDTSKQTPTIKLFTFLKPPQATDWERVLKYNHRVRLVEMAWFGPYYRYGVLDDAAIRTLTTECPGDLLPNVHYISLQLGLPFLSSALPGCSDHFLSRVRNITLDEDLFPFNLSVTCSAVQLYCPQVKSLNFSSPMTTFGEVPEDIDWPALTPMICNLHQLEKVVLDTRICQALVELSPARKSNPIPAFDHFARLDTLVSLKLSCTYIPTRLLERYLNSCSGRFPVLKELDLSDMEEYKDACAVLRSFLDGRQPGQGLHQLALHIDSPERSGFCAEFSDFMETITSPLLAESLQHLKIRTWGWSDERTEEDASLDQDIMTSFARLFAIPHLQHFSYYGTMSSRLDDAWFTEAAKSWHELRSISFSTDSSTPMATLRTYLSFVQRCPQLDSINIPVSWVPFDLELLSHCNPKRGNHRVKSLHRAKFPPTMENPEHVYRCIKGLFPNFWNLELAKEVRMDMGWMELYLLLVGYRVGMLTDPLKGRQAQLANKFSEMCSLMEEFKVAMQALRDGYLIIPGLSVE